MCWKDNGLKHSVAVLFKHTVMFQSIPSEAVFMPVWF